MFSAVWVDLITSSLHGKSELNASSSLPAWNQRCFIYITYGVGLHEEGVGRGTNTHKRTHTDRIRSEVDPRPLCMSEKLSAPYDHFLILLVLA